MTSTIRDCKAYFFVALAGAMLGGCGGSSGASVTSGTPVASGTSGTPVASGTGSPTATSGSGGTPNTGGTPPAPAPAPPVAATQGTVTISGSPASSAAAGSSYNFHPTASDTVAATLTFAIKNQPSWAKFDPATGTLSGTPTAANVGSYAQIQITVSDGASSAALPAFSINITQATTGVASLSWALPLANPDGTPANLAGYHIYYGPSATELTHVVNVTDPNSTSFVIGDIAIGTWYFAMTAYDNSKVESSFSAVVPVKI